MSTTTKIAHYTYSMQAGSLCGLSRKEMVEAYSSNAPRCAECARIAAERDHPVVVDRIG